MIRTVLSSTLAATLGSSVWISRARQGRNGATRSSGPSASAVRQRSSSGAGIANGMILTVATIWRGSTTACSGRVASVTASSMRLKRSTRSRSTTSRPRARRMQVGAAGEGRRDLDRVAGHRGGELRRRLVLGHVGAADARGDHGIDPGIAQPLRDRAATSTVALAQHDVAGLDAVREHGTFGVGESETVELHRRSSLALRSAIYSDSRSRSARARQARERG